jgi:emfourin
MNIHFERSGGFAGLRLSHDVDSSQLSSDEQKELQELVNTAGFFDLPANLRAKDPGADRFQYKLTMKAGPREHTVDADDVSLPENLRPLLNWLMAKVRKR